MAKGMLKYLRTKKDLFIPTVGHILFIAIFLKLSISAGGDLLNDSDTGWHIRTGEYMIRTQTIPREDIFSFSKPSGEWLNHEWLAEIIMAFVHARFGLTGVVIFFSFMISLIYYLLFKVIRKSGTNIISAAFIVFLAIIASKLNWLARPNILSLFLFLIWYYILDTFQHCRRSYLFLLPPVMVLWVNLHGGFLSGFVLLGIYLFSNLLSFFSSSGTQKTSYLNKTKLLGMTAAGCLFASLINPYTYHVLLIPMKLRSIGFIIDNTQEFLSPNFHEPNMTPFRYLLFLTITIIAMGPKRLSLVELILVLCFTNMALYSVRFIPFFAIIVAPILAKHSDLIINQFGGRAFRFFKERVKNISSIDTSAKGYVWVFIMVFIVLLAAANGKIKYQFDETKAPLRAMEFLQKTGLKGNMYNDFQFGGHIIYHLYPNYKVFIDGRTELYGNERVAEYGRVAQLDPGWQKVIEKYEVNWIICVSKSRLSAMLDGNRDWHRIYRDRVASIFIRDVFDNRSLIERYG